MSREETAFKLNIAKTTAETLDRQGKESAERRGKAPSQETQFVTPQERALLDRAGKSSDEKRTHATENIAREYGKKS